VTRIDLTGGEELFRLLVESVRDYAIFMLDAKGCVATWNPGAERLKGYRADEIVGRHFSTFYPEVDIAAGKCEMELEVAAREGRFEDEGWRVRKDGSQFWANVVISAVHDMRGELVGFSKVTRDLTERRRNEDERARRLAAEQANRAKDQFLAVLGHELRNPLAPIVTAVQLLKVRNAGKPNRELDVIERQLGHMMRLVDDLLDTSRIKEGKVALKMKPTQLRDVIARAIETAGPLIEHRGHTLDVTLPPVPLAVNGDEARLTQVVSNLLVNAAKYTDPGGHIWILARIEGDRVVVDVRDDGIGIEPALLPHVFELFAQSHGTGDRARGGLGIGLALVRSLVVQHGGDVTARSDGPGQGSTFTLRLPRLEGEHDPRLAHASGAFVVASKRRVLIVDDNEDALELLGEAIAAHGHDVRTAPDAKAALEIARAFQPEIGILDIGLPVMDGYELAGRLREQLGQAKLHLIALTGYAQPSDRSRSAQAGFDQHFAKPVDVRSLSDAIARA
jgi:PAS domain S-box-containing protein